MKRRGFTPTFFTFITMMAGYSKVEDWQGRTKQLDNVHTLMANFDQFVKRAKESGDVKGMNSDPTALYIRVLGDAHLYQKMFDVFNEMDADGPFATDSRTYSAILHALSERYPRGEMSLEASNAQKASDAKLVWKQMLKASEKLGFTPDSHVIVAMLRCLARGRPPHVLFAQDIIHEWCGLSKPGESQLPPVISVDPHVIGAILTVCNVNNKYRLAVHYVQQIMDRALLPGETVPLDRENMEQVLQSYTYLAALGSMSEADQALETLQWMLRQEVLNPAIAYKLRPRLETYSLVLIACWRGADWKSAIRTFELLTGCHGTDFWDGHTSKPQIEQRSRGRNLEPNATVLATMLRTALASRDRANMRQCLRIVDYYGVEKTLNELVELYTPHNPAPAPAQLPAAWLEDGGSRPARGAQIRSRHEEKERKFYGAKLAEALQDVVDKVLAKGMPAAGIEGSKLVEKEKESDEGYVITDEERARWASFRTQAKRILRIIRQLKLEFTTPRHEDDPLGSAHRLASVDQHVDFEMTHRHMKSA